MVLTSDHDSEKNVLLFLAPHHAGSGNATTVDRLTRYFDEIVREPVVAGRLRWFVKVVDVNEELQVMKQVSVNDVRLVVLLHAWRSGRWLEQLFPDTSKRHDTPSDAYIAKAANANHPGGLEHVSPKVVTIFGGTDVNEMLRDFEKEPLIARVVARSEHLVCFSEDMRDKVCSWHPEAVSKCAVIPQAALCLARSLELAEQDDALDSLLVDCGVTVLPNTTAFIAPMGIRSVKDPMFIARVFSEHIHRRFESSYLLFVGPVHDESLCEEVKRAGAGVLFHSYVPRDVLHNSLSSPRVMGVINCSLSEGQPQAVMEGMLCGAPAMMRRIPGNEAVATHEVSATFFSTPAEFVEAALKHLTWPEYISSLRVTARHYILHAFSEESEKAAYRVLLARCIGPSE
ncbi:putative glycosyltransferase 1 domain-containing protein 1 [Diplonema papillatum]|nr:putative glycosyltransferase 1 domain-containing protein 1 [Diplonema papillatum]